MGSSLCFRRYIYVYSSGNNKKLVDTRPCEQASQPFSADELEYISRLDPDYDALLLSAMLPSLRTSAIRTMVLTTTLLQKAALMGSNLSEIGALISRSLNTSNAENKSPLENFIDDLLEELYLSEEKKFKYAGRELRPQESEQEDTFFHLDMEEESCVSSFTNSPRESESSSASWRCLSGSSSPFCGRPNTPQELPEEKWQSFMQMYRQTLGAFIQKSRSGGLTKSCGF